MKQSTYLSESEIFFPGLLTFLNNHNYFKKPALQVCSPLTFLSLQIITSVRLLICFLEFLSNNTQAVVNHPAISEADQSGNTFTYTYTR